MSRGLLVVIAISIVLVAIGRYFGWLTGPVMME